MELPKARNLYDRNRYPQAGTRTESAAFSKIPPPTIFPIPYHHSLCKRSHWVALTFCENHSDFN